MTQPALPPSDFIKQYSKQMQQALLDVGFWKSCVNCESWSNNSAERKDAKPDHICHRWNCQPPPEVIVLGCENWLCIVPF